MVVSHQFLVVVVAVVASWADLGVVPSSAWAVLRDPGASIGAQRAKHILNLHRRVRLVCGNYFFGEALFEKNNLPSMGSRASKQPEC